MDRPFYKTTFFMILMLIVFFPVGIVLLFAYHDEISKTIKVFISVLVIIVMCFVYSNVYNFIVSKPDEHNLTDSSSIYSDTTSKNEQSLLVDEKINQCMIDAQINHSNLLQAIIDTNNQEESIDELHETSVVTIMKQKNILQDLDSIEEPEADDYLLLCKSYVSLSISIANNLVNYLDAQDPQYALNAVEMLKSMQYAELTVSMQRMSFLHAAGFSQKEIFAALGKDSKKIINENSTPTVGYLSDLDIEDNLKIENVNNDVTQSWKLTYLSELKENDIEKYAVSYYEKYFTNDNEVHFLVNSDKTKVNVITNPGGVGVLNVRVHTLNDGDEKDANTILSGNILDEYLVYVDSKNITKIN